MNLTSGDGSGERIKSLGVHKLEETTRPKHMKRKLLALCIEYIRVLVCPWSKKEQLNLFKSKKKSSTDISTSRRTLRRTSEVPSEGDTALRISREE